MPKPLRKLYWKSRRFYEIATFCRRMSSIWDPRFPLAVHRALRLCRRHRFEPAEAFRLGLFRPGEDNGGLASYVSRKRLTAAQEALNPAGYASLLKNKDLFYRYCTALGIPIPQLYAIIQPSSPGWSYVGHPIALLFGMGHTTARPCTNAGNPSMLLQEEPTPNGHRLNLGIYSGTAYANKSL